MNSEKTIHLTKQRWLNSKLDNANNMWLVVFMWISGMEVLIQWNLEEQTNERIALETVNN